MQKVELQIGDKVPTSFDLAYARYCDWCARMRFPVGQYSEWLRVEKAMSGFSFALSTPTAEQSHRAVAGRRVTERAKKFARSTPPPTGI